MAWEDARAYALRYVPFEVSKVASRYGSGTYGDGSYGSEATDPLSNVEYVLAPHGGDWPAQPAWSYRVGDESTFDASLFGIDGPMDFSPIAGAVLFLERVSHGDRVIRVFDLELVTTTVNDHYVRRQWLPTDLDTEGRYRCVVQLRSKSGRLMSIDGGDAAMLDVGGV